MFKLDTEAWVVTTALEFLKNGPELAVQLIFDSGLRNWYILILETRNCSFLFKKGNLLDLIRAGMRCFFAQEANVAVTKIGIV